ncbi:hypothetical protein [Arthrobacter sp. I3]|uniref:hypothetical protein n=1 Tax=Arthrobacter sp. I3 TaxID=218158 RepID=UPI000486733A|nr:hypothetical protein [Arthrobacter sp. I3]
MAAPGCGRDDDGLQLPNPTAVQAGVDPGDARAALQYCVGRTVQDAGGRRAQEPAAPAAGTDKDSPAIGCELRQS